MRSQSPPQTKFRFKSKPNDTRNTPSRRRSRSPSSTYHRDRSDRHHNRKSHYHHDAGPRSDSPQRPRPASPETAFRESLFDALADDEGAAYWEGVYGQPIHTYSRCRTSSHQSGGNESAPDPSEKPALERMSDDEYASYVRARMWEKSHAYIVEERAQREKARQRQRSAKATQRDTMKEGEARVAWDESLGHAANRRQTKARQSEARAAWTRYQDGWGKLKSEAESMEPTQHDTTPLPRGDCPLGRVQIPWPTTSGHPEDIQQDSVEQFFRQSVATMISPDSVSVPIQADLRSIIKAERVRWHPDKMRQRYGRVAIDDDAMRNTTSVFQILDSFWTSLKNEDKTMA